VELTLRWDKLNALFESLKLMILKFGLIQFFAFLAGIWAGIKGLQTNGSSPVSSANKPFTGNA